MRQFVPTLPATTVAQLLDNRAQDPNPGLLFEDRSWTWAEVVEASRRRAAALDHLLDPDRPRHVAVLLENVPEFVFLLGAAALTGTTLVALNRSRFFRSPIT